MNKRKTGPGSEGSAGRLLWPSHQLASLIPSRPLRRVIPGTQGRTWHCAGSRTPHKSGHPQRLCHSPHPLLAPLCSALTPPGCPQQGRQPPASGGQSRGPENSLPQLLGHLDRLDFLCLLVPASSPGLPPFLRAPPAHEASPTAAAPCYMQDLTDGIPCPTLSPNSDLNPNLDVSLRIFTST